jgi:hypothetical protein
MYHFFARNEELKSKKESKKYPQQHQLGPPIALVGAPSTHTYTCHQILSKSPIYVHATIHLRNNGAHHIHYTNVQSEGVEYSKRLPKNLWQRVEGLSPS